LLALFLLLNKKLVPTMRSRFSCFFSETHKGSETATIAIRGEDHMIVMELKDAARGIPLDSR
jgi:hypothetical protein